MMWIIQFIVSIALVILLIPFSQLLFLLPAGLLGMVLSYIIDSTFVYLGAFNYRYPNPFLLRIPLFYWLSSFSGGVLLLHYYPQRQSLQFPYIVLASTLFLASELLMYKLGYFHYGRWSPFKSLILNIFGFIVTVYLSELLMVRF